MSTPAVPQCERAELARGTPPGPARHSRASAGRSDSAVAEYTLVHHEPDDPGEGYAMGWKLVARYDSWSWSAALGGRGAGTQARARVAQAVAVRVLTEQGVTVDGWSRGGNEDQHEPPTVFRAGVGPPPQATGEPAPAPRQW